MKNLIEGHIANEPYRGLANAIIIQACDDYMLGKITENSFKFFCLGQWFKALTNVDGEYVYKNMRSKKYDCKGNKGKN